MMFLANREDLVTRKNVLDAQEVEESVEMPTVLDMMDVLAKMSNAA